MWDAFLVIPKYIVPSHPALVKTLEKFCKCTSNFVAPRICWTDIFCGPLLTWPTQVYNIFSVVRRQLIYKNWTSNGGEKLGWCCKKLQEQSFVSDHTREGIAENWSDWLDELELIKKRIQLENTYKTCAQLLCIAFNVAYAVLLL